MKKVKIEMKTDDLGVEFGNVYPASFKAGEQYEIDYSLAQQFFIKGSAVAVVEEPKKEQPKSENAQIKTVAEKHKKTKKRGVK